MNELFTKESISDLTVKDKYEVTVLFENVPQELAGLIKQGDMVRVNNNEKTFGTVKKTRSTGTSVSVMNPMTRSIETHVSDDTFNVSVVISVTTSTEGNSTKVSGIELKNGTVIDFSVPSYSSLGTITNVKRLG